MTEKQVIIDTEIQELLQLVSNDELDGEMNDAVASIVQNQEVTWIKFVLTDDMPNGNRQRVPQEEFKNIQKSGVFMPIKMARGKIADGHDGAEPIGVITHIKQVANKLIGMAALWSRERPEDVEYIKNAVNNKKTPINVSWELGYTDGEVNDNLGSVDLRNTSLRGVTIVGIPAYSGRTQLIAVATKGGNAYLEALPDAAFLYVKDNEEGNKVRLFPVYDSTQNLDKEMLEEAKTSLEQSDLSDEKKSELRESIKLLESNLAVQNQNIEEPQVEQINTEDNTLDEKEIKALQDALEVAKTEATEAKASLDQLTAAKSELEVEVEALKSYKQEAEEKVAAEAKFEAVKKKFQDAGIEKDEKYFEDEKEKLLALDDEALDFMVQNLVAFKEEAGSAEASLKKFNVPNVKGQVTSNDIGTLVQGLRDYEKAKKL